MTRRIVFGLLGLVSFVIGMTGAAGAGADWADRSYFAGQLGAFVPGDDLDDADLHTRTAFLLSYGYHLTPTLSVEGAAGYAAAHGDHSRFYPVVGYTDVDMNLAVLPLTVSLVGHLPLGRLELEGGGGVGLYYAYFDGDLDNFWWDHRTFNDSDFVTGVHLEAAVTYRFASRFSAGISARRWWTQEAGFHDSVHGVAVRLDANLDGWVVGGRIGFQF
ncbi:outer membrane beta-barrel protein [Dissulfurirhabdus thermomarina]|uniref:Outer membrane beta-barrel protein n=1 Tax=Dissulfurirhabdus thermomarina TaxID=1765737 RepID=A0A6N9TSC1_DISTH|nr:outer membrane beta-barrel protein [Dissulfurirhabdus thermomarina]NDY41456.1 outer membrane beta-barrel protein [Dissulfurirhabdus thermomarina]NMX24262.1 outer membrane beta-barrel protein [Dissulfurirhabdus thermomarina]